MRVVVISIDGFAGFYWDDPRARTPTLRRLAERGVVASRMQCVFPSTTWPTHVSIVTGVKPERHGVAANHVLNRETGKIEDFTGDPIYDAARLLRVPTIYDRAHAAGRRCAAIDWPATRNSPSFAFNLPFFKNQRIFETQTSPAVWRELGALGYPIDRMGEWAELPKRFLKDAMVGDLMTTVWQRHQPDLLFAHFLCADSLQHLYGPRSPEGYWAIEYIDDRIRRFLDSLAAGALDRDTAVFVVSDHGFLPSTQEIRLNVWLRQRGLLTVGADGAITHAAARLVMNHGGAYVYVLEGDRQAIAADLAREIGKLEGVAGAWTESQYAALGIPTPAENAFVGEVALDATPGYCFGDTAVGAALLGPPKYRGTHGQRPEYDENHAFFLATGPGIRRGTTLAPIVSRDVAPTLAQWLDLRMPDVDRPPLADVFA